ncbi:MAG: bifunctional 23S rRNA (guanine(2069)-N(7))-methyltransferase RlmK/23S rRNA (guanine(2445)-N(2))-methyltransferase RlmL [Planctomycetota bacterium]
MTDEFTISASCAFGLESIVKRELQWLDANPRVVSPGRIDFTSDAEAIARANVWLRSASRVGVVLAEGKASDFDDLFALVRQVDWPAYLPSDARVTVHARARHSAINSPRSAQGVVKRAIAETMVGRDERMPETGSSFTVEATVLNDKATIVLDTSGDGLHRRGYRTRSLPGQLKENLAAAIIMMTGWRGDRPLIDPFCGRGTIVIEAAMIAAGIAPGWKRPFAGEHLPWIRNDAWASARANARPTELPTGLPQLMGRDADSYAVGDARRAAEAAGVTGLVGFRVDDFTAITRPADKGWVITNPPYGSRVLDHEAARSIHAQLPDVLSTLPGWSHAVLTAFPEFERLIRQDASKRRKLYNGKLRCDLYIFKPRPTTDDAPRAAFGDTSDRDGIAEAFRNTLRKRIRHLRKWPSRGIECFRLYDGQTPGARLYVDRYADHLHVAQLEQTQPRAAGDEAAWHRRLIDIVREETGTDASRVHVKQRRRQRGSNQYERIDERGGPIRVREHDLSFEIELQSRLDTGLFLDHRPARQLIRQWAQGARVLNLFCYTGAFTVAAAAGGATGSVSVDLSPVYLDWASRNLELNGLANRQHTLIEADAMGWLANGAEGRRFDLIIVDPPTFSNSKRTSTVFDVQRDHRLLLGRCMELLNADGRVFFSTNNRRFKLSDPAEFGATARELTRKTVPEDFPRSKPHQSWEFRRDQST